ncbi:MAG: hypothetical protein M3228_04600 [Actinomycetota bacterium]|nr:hypothetical protein [Actinomycetota bacterium]
MTAELALVPSQRAIRRLDGVSDGEAAAGVRALAVVVGMATTSLCRLGTAPLLAWALARLPATGRSEW